MVSTTTTAKPFWLVFRGHFLFDWDEDGVTVHVPVLEVPHGHSYKVSTSGSPTWAGIVGGDHAVTGMQSIKPLYEPDSTQHLRHSKAVLLSRPQNGLARVRLSVKPSAIHVLAGRTAPAVEFRNGMDASTVLSPVDGGNYHLCDLAVWEYSAVNPPVFRNGKQPVNAFPVNGGLAMVFTADPQGTGTGGGGHAGHAGHPGRKGINDILTVNQVATTYKFADEITGAQPFVGYEGFEWLEALFPVPVGFFDGVLMGSCDASNAGPQG